MLKMWNFQEPPRFVWWVHVQWHHSWCHVMSWKWNMMLVMTQMVLTCLRHDASPHRKTGFWPAALAWWITWCYICMNNLFSASKHIQVMFHTLQCHYAIHVITVLIVYTILFSWNNIRKELPSLGTNFKLYLHCACSL